MTTNLTHVKAADLAVGTWISTDGPAKLLLAEPFTDADGPGIYLTYRRVGGAIDSYAAEPDQLFEIVSETELAYVRSQADRAQKIVDIRALADYLEANPWMPMPYSLHGQTHGLTGDDVPMIRQLAERAGREVDDSRDDRTDFDIHFGCADFSVIAWHHSGRPAEPLADPLGLNYTRADDDAEDPTPTGPREPLHTGGMTEGGLVDETSDGSYLVDHGPVKPPYGTTDREAYERNQAVDEPFYSPAAGDAGELYGDTTGGALR